MDASAPAHTTDICYMTSPWQHYNYYEHAHYVTKWRIRHTHLCKMRCINPRLTVMITQVACHGRTLNKMEWIYTKTKVRGQGTLELALEKVKEEWETALFLQFEKQLVQTYMYMCTWLFPWMFQGLMDRYSGIDHKYVKVKALCHDIRVIFSKLVSHVM